MREYERYLQDGEQQTIRRGTKPAGGWKNRTVIVLNEHDQALISAEAYSAPKVSPWRFRWRHDAAA